MTRKREGCELSCQYWELNQDLLEQQLLLLTIELSPKPKNIAFIFKNSDPFTCNGLNFFCGVFFHSQVQGNFLLVLLKYKSILAFIS